MEVLYLKCQHPCNAAIDIFILPSFSYGTKFNIDMLGYLNWIFSNSND